MRARSRAAWPWCRLASACFALASFATLALGQSTLRELQPPPPVYPFDRFGMSVAAVGDVDNDGVLDYAVGSAQDFFWDPGRVSIFSGSSGAASTQVWGLHTGQQFGYRLASVGDTDGDGYTDLLVMAPGAASPAYAEIRLFSARTGTTLWSHTQPASTVPDSVRFVGGGEDVDGDSVPDFGAAGWWTNIDETLRIYSGASHALIHELGLSPQDPAHGPFAMLGDLDGDARSEIAYTALPAGAWTVHIVSGASGAIVRTCVPSPPISASLFASIAALGDIDGDGACDLAIGAAQACVVHVFSGATAAQIRMHSDSESTSWFGHALAGGADLDHDGVGDLLVGAPQASANRGKVVAFSGRTGAHILTEMYGTGQVQAGWSLCAAGDFNGDGFGDYLVGGPHWSNQHGRAWLQSPSPLPPRLVGTPKVNSLGCTPAMSWTGSASATAVQSFVISATNVLNQKTGMFFYGVGDPVAIPFQGGTHSAPAPRRRTFRQASGGSTSGSDCSGTFAFDFNARIQSGVDPALIVGARVVGQYWSRDPADPFTTNLSGGVELVIGP